MTSPLCPTCGSDEPKECRYMYSDGPHEHGNYSGVGVGHCPDDFHAPPAKDETLPCGHPLSAVWSADEGTAHCQECARETKDETQPGNIPKPGVWPREGKMTCGHHQANWIFEDEESGYGFCGMCHPEKLRQPAGEGEVERARKMHSYWFNECLGDMTHGGVTGNHATKHRESLDALIAAERADEREKVRDEETVRLALKLGEVDAAWQEKVKAERADAKLEAVEGMHAPNCQCLPAGYFPGHGQPMTVRDYVDPNCLAARKKVTDDPR